MKQKIRMIASVILDAVYISFILVVGLLVGILLQIGYRIDAKN